MRRPGTNGATRPPGQAGRGSPCLGRQRSRTLEAVEAQGSPPWIQQHPVWARPGLWDIPRVGAFAVRRSAAQAWLAQERVTLLDHFEYA